MGDYPKVPVLTRIPLARGTKVPLPHGWSTLPADSPVWAETFAAHPGCGTALRLEHLVVVDCDSAERVSWWQEKGHPTPFISRGLPERRSFWYRRPEDCGLVLTRYPDWEIRTTAKGFCVIPPSIHKITRAPYEWLGPPVDEDHWLDIPWAPVEALESFQRPGITGSGVEGWSVVLEGEGRDNFLTAQGGFWKRRNMGEAGILAGLIAVNQVYCVPPLPTSALERIARSVSRYAAEPVYHLEVVDGTEDQGLRAGRAGRPAPAVGYRMVVTGTGGQGSSDSGGG
jgi:bifunctional DNA primase/polymerase-like protein/primase-like protein